MPRSKRRGATSDFPRKKVKLGQKQLPQNRTNTSITTRKIHVPNQTRSPSTTTGPPLVQLLSRTRHHNPNTRLTTLNTLCNAITDTHATAHTIIATPSTAILTAGHSLCDDSAPVRAAAGNLLRRLGQAVDITPFKDAITALLLAALTHSSLDIRVQTAALLTTLSAEQQILSESPLPALSDLLTTPRPRARSTTLAAIAAICKGRERHPTQPKRRFGYHCESKVSQDADFLIALPVNQRALLITRVADAVLEHLHHPPRTIGTSCEALAAVVSKGIPEESRKPVERALKAWRHTGDTHSLARVALSVGNVALATGYMENILQRDRYNDTLDAVVRECVHVPRVALAFGDRFQRAVGECDTVFVKKGFKTAVMVMEGCEADLLVRAVPPAVKLLNEGDDDIACGLVKAACSAWKTSIRDNGLAEELVGVCTSGLVTRVVDEVVGVALCAGVLTGEACVGVLGDCVRQGRMHVVDRFLEALEWLASCDGEERLRAVALARALGRVVGDGVAECVNRIEAVV